MCLVALIIGTKSRASDADGVLRNLNEVEHRFQQLHRRTINELDDETKRSDLLAFLNSPPIIVRLEYRQKINEIFPKLKGETTIRDMFDHLSPLLDFLGYGLLEHIVNEFGSDDLKKDLNKYSEDVKKFMKETTVKQLMYIWSGEHDDIPSNFSRLKAKLDEDPKYYTLYRLDRLRRDYCVEMRLSDVVLVLIGLEMSKSFIVEWLVPSALVPKLVESARNLDSGFYLREHILKVVVGEKQIFPFLPDSQPKVPALQTTAAMVTVILRLLKLFLLSLLKLILDGHTSSSDHHSSHCNTCTTY